MEAVNHLILDCRTAEWKNWFYPLSILCPSCLVFKQFPVTLRPSPTRPRRRQTLARPQYLLTYLFIYNITYSLFLGKRERERKKFFPSTRRTTRRQDVRECGRRKKKLFIHIVYNQFGDMESTGERKKKWMWTRRSAIQTTHTVLAFLKTKYNNTKDLKTSEK